MADNSLEYVVDENDLATKANRKMIFVGNHTQLTNLSPTYSGQYVFATTTGGSFILDNYYKRNAANDAWLTGIRLGTENVESSTNSGSVSASAATLTGVRFYHQFTLPTTEKFYVITGIEWHNGATVSGNIQCGIEVTNANPPTVAATELMGISSQVAQSGTDQIQRNSNISCNPIRNGTTMNAWISIDNNTGLLGYTVSTSTTSQKAIAYTSTPLLSNSTAWSANSQIFYIKVYYRGYMQ